MKKRSIVAIAIALILGLALAVLPLATQAAKTDVPSANPVSVWDGTSKSTSLSTDGSGAFLIQSAADLAYFADSVNGGNNYDKKTVKLTTDIRWNDVTNFASWTKTTTGLNQWTRIGNNWSRVFAGTFDGQGHTVSGIYYVYTTSSGGGDQAHGFFGNLIGTVKNLNLKNCYFDGTNGQWATKIGAIAGLTQWGNPTIDNCHVVDTVVDGSGKVHVGGLVGTPWADAATFTLTNSSFSGTVKAASYAGGLVGRSGAQKLTIDKCTFNGTIALTGESNGGIIGYFDPGTKGSESTVSNCVVSGTISGGSHGIGGIVGTTNAGVYSGNNVNEKITVTSCVNTANITASQHFVGGIVGGHGRNGITTTATNVLLIEDCLNTGKVTGGTGDWMQYGGGILGGMENGASSTTIKNCVNLGDVHIWGYSGGIFGGFKWETAQQTAVVSGCVNLGTVTSLRGNADTDGSFFGNKPNATTVSNGLVASEANAGVGGNLATLAGVTVKTKAEILASTEQNLAALGLTNWKIANGTFELKTRYVPGAKTAAVDFAAAVTLEGKAIAADQFTVNLFKANASFVPEATALRTAKNDVNGIADLGSVELPAGTHYFVMKQVKETVSGYTYDEGVYNVTVTVDDFGNIMAASTAKVGDASIPTSFSFKNTYTVSPSALNLSAKVNLAGRTLKAEEFSFAIYATTSEFDPPVTAALQAVKNDIEGNVYFTDVQNYTTAGTYYYIVKQQSSSVPGVTFDSAVYNVTVSVVDEGGTLKATPSALKAGAGAPSEIVFANAYAAAPAEYALSAKVTLSGKPLAADLFSYGLYSTGMSFQVSGDPLKTAKNAADGTVDLGKISVPAKGTYYYVLKQNDFAAKGYEAAVTEYLITVTAVDQGDGTLSVSHTASKKGEATASALEFANTYEKPVTRIEKPADASVFDGTVSESLRTEGAKVYIDSAADLAKFAAMVSGGTTFAGKTVVLNVDIVWNATGDAKEWAAGKNLPANTWSCGAWGKWFAGAFDGNGHTIYGLYGKADKDNFGFIAAATGGASVKNLVLANSAFVSTKTPNANLGGVIGTIFAGKVVVDNVYAEVFLSAPDSNNVGGIVGYVHKTTGTDITVSDTVFAGSVTGKDNVGGIVGFMTNAPDDGTVTGVAKLNNVLNKGTVTGKGNVGGLVGCNNKQTFVTVNDSLSVGLVTYTTGGAIYGKYNTTTAPTVTDAYYLDVSASAPGAGLTATSVSADKLYGDAAKTNLTGLDFAANWSVVADDAPLPTSVFQLLKLNAGAGEGEGGEGGEGEAKLEIVLPDPKPSKKASVYDGTVSKKLRTEGKTVYIDSAADLAYLAKKVTEGSGYLGKTIVLTTDIIWNVGDADKWAAGTETPKYSWTFGGWNKWFQGTFDGNGHVISGLFNTSEKDNTGFINAVGGKSVVVKNLVIVNSTFLHTGKGNANMGMIGVTGEGAKVTVTNCYVDANFISASGNQVGGIIGRVHNKGCEANISNTVFAGTVSGNSGVGGFIGRADCNNADDAAKVTVKNSLNMGTVMGASGVAGFVGFNNKGTVTLENCINAGTVSGGEASAFFGTGTELVTLKDCVYVAGSAEKATDADRKDGVSVVEAKAIVGDAAVTTLTKFDFKKVWTPVSKCYPLPISVYKLVYGADPEKNPATGDFVPGLCLALTVVSAGAALLLSRKRKA